MQHRRAIFAATLLLTACSGTDRLMVQLGDEGCRTRDYTQHPCPVYHAPVDAPRYCYPTLAQVDCYDAEVRFGPEPMWQRSPMPDIGR